VPRLVESRPCLVVYFTINDQVSEKEEGAMQRR